jgi:hypothetical protein
MRGSAQSLLNRIHYNLEKYLRSTEKIGFLTICKRNDIVPTSLQIKIPTCIERRRFGKNMMETQNRRVIKELISILFAKKRSIEKEILELKMRLHYEYGMTVEEIEENIQKFQWTTMQYLPEIRSQLRDKFRKLLLKKKEQKARSEEAKRKLLQYRFPNGRTLVYNNSHRELNQKETELLSLGLNFAITEKEFPVIEYIQATEKLCQHIEKSNVDEDIEKANQIRTIISRHMQSEMQKNIKQNLSKDENMIIKSLKEDQSIVICAADKGRAIVIEDKNSYLQKLQNQLDEGDYELSDRKEENIVQSIHRKLVNKLFEMGLKENSEYRKYTVTGSKLAHMYLLIKVHKRGFPARAVVNQVDDPTYKICKALTQILNPIEQKGAAFIKDSFHLKDLLKEVKMEPTFRMASLDVKALYPSIPCKEALEITKQELLKDLVSLSGRTKWKVEDIMDLLKIALETYFKTLDNKIFKQTDGTPIGKSISGPLAGIYMNWFEEEFVYKCNNFKPVFWKRMRDDVFVIWDHTKYNFKDFVNDLNSKNERIQFTTEEEVEGAIPFLDLMIHRNDDSLWTKTYRKPTHTQAYVNWQSNHPKTMLLGVLKGLIHRAYYFCDKEEDLQDELKLLQDVFEINEYPKHLITKAMKTSQKKETDKMIQKLMETVEDEPEEEEENYYGVLHAPYVKNFTEKVSRDLKKT